MDPPSRSSDYGPARPWLTCILPLGIFMAFGVVEPAPSGGNLAAAIGIPYAAYPAIYAVRVIVAVAVLAWLSPQLRAWLGRPTWWPPVLGMALTVPWVILTTLQRDAGWTTGLGERSAYDPFASDGLASEPTIAWSFLAVRLIGLVLVVPVVEELFLRGFLMRYAIEEHFWQVPFGTLTFASASACLLYACASHPAEAVAAVGWFAIVSGIAAATRKPIDCILCHAATNLALGVYVFATDSWWLL